MTKYHINPSSGEPGKCSAVKGKCPFADSEDHFDSVDDAREASEELYTAFDRWYTPTLEQDGKFAVDLYDGFVLSVEYDDYSRAQAGQVARHIISDVNNYSVTEDSRYNATLNFPKVPGTQDVKVHINTKRNRVHYEVYAGEKLMWESEIEDVDSGAAMKQYIEQIVYEVDNAYDDGDFTNG